MMRKVVECDIGEDSSTQYYFWWGVCENLSAKYPYFLNHWETSIAILAPPLQKPKKVLFSNSLTTITYNALKTSQILIII